MKKLVSVLLCLLLVVAIGGMIWVTNLSVVGNDVSDLNVEENTWPSPDISNGGNEPNGWPSPDIS